MSAGDKAIILAQVGNQSRGNSVREPRKGRGTGSLLRKQARYWW
jgi:hypothetical protein